MSFSQHFRPSRGLILFSAWRLFSFPLHLSSHSRSENEWETDERTPAIQRAFTRLTFGRQIPASALTWSWKRDWNHSRVHLASPWMEQRTERTFWLNCCHKNCTRLVRFVKSIQLILFYSFSLALTKLISACQLLNVVKSYKLWFPICFFFFYHSLPLSIRY